MKHKHADVATKWLNDTSLVILYKDGKWEKLFNQDYPMWMGDLKYFLVCEKHVEVALYWLNGGDIQLKSSCQKWLGTSADRGNFPIYFDPDIEYRIKPKTEILFVWLGFAPNTSIITLQDESHKALYPEITTWTQVEMEREI